MNFVFGWMATSQAPEAILLSERKQQSSFSWLPSAGAQWVL